MIVISASLPKSGSTLIANYQEDLLAAVAPRNGQAHLAQVFGGRFVGTLGLPTIARLLLIERRHGPIVVKTHSRATPLLQALIRSGRARATYCYRDPRDVILSSIDHGERSRAGQDPSRAFAQYTSIDAAIPEVLHLVGRWRSWQRFGQAHFIRYESLMADKLAALRAMSSYLGWPRPAAELEALVAKHQPRRGVSHNFNKGTTLRYKTEMSPADIARCTAAMRQILADYEYELA